MIKVGLIGGIAAGKSEVARMLRELGARVVDADHLAHQAYAPGTPGREAVLRAFGQEIAAPDGSIDRAKLGALVFGDTGRLKQLTDIVWPLTGRLAQEQIRLAEAEGVEVFVLEAAVLVEAGWRGLVDEVWLVRAPLAQVRQRLRGRGLDDAAIDARLASRDRLAEAAAEASLVIENDAGLPELAARVQAAWAGLRQRARL